MLEIIERIKRDVIEIGTSGNLHRMTCNMILMDLADLRRAIIAERKEAQTNRLGSTAK